MWSVVSGQWSVISVQLLATAEAELDLGCAAQDVGDELDKSVGRRQMITRVDEEQYVLGCQPT